MQNETLKFKYTTCNLIELTESIQTKITELSGIPMIMDVCNGNGKVIGEYFAVYLGSSYNFSTRYLNDRTHVFLVYVPNTRTILKGHIKTGPDEYDLSKYAIQLDYQYIPIKNKYRVKEREEENYIELEDYVEKKLREFV